LRALSARRALAGRASPADVARRTLDQSPRRHAYVETPVRPQPAARGRDVQRSPGGRQLKPPSQRRYRQPAAAPAPLGVRRPPGLLAERSAPSRRWRRAVTARDGGASADARPESPRPQAANALEPGSGTPDPNRYAAGARRTRSRPRTARPMPPSDPLPPRGAPPRRQPPKRRS
jgi:hypothetical protein